MADEMRIAQLEGHLKHCEERVWEAGTPWTTPSASAVTR